MTLINCTECNKSISSTATACPLCGCPIVDSPKEKVNADSQKEKMKKKRSSSHPKKISTFLISVIFFSGLYGAKVHIESGYPQIWNIEGEVFSRILIGLLFLILLKLILSLVRHMGGARKVGGFLLLLLLIPWFYQEDDTSTHSFASNSSETKSPGSCLWGGCARKATIYIGLETEMYFPELSRYDITGDGWHEDNVCASHRSKARKETERLRDNFIEFQNSNPLTHLIYCRVAER